jgi:glycerate kinase
MAARLRHDPRGVPMTGAAGGLAGGLWATFDATLVAGAPFVLDAIDFDRRLRAAQAVVLGEGRLDETTLDGKVLAEAATRARQLGVPAHAIVAINDLNRFDQRILDLQTIQEARSERELRTAATKLARSL